MWNGCVTNQKVNISVLLLDKDDHCCQAGKINRKFMPIMVIGNSKCPPRYGLLQREIKNECVMEENGDGMGKNEDDVKDKDWWVQS